VSVDASRSLFVGLGGIDIRVRRGVDDGVGRVLAQCAFDGSTIDDVAVVSTQSDD